jgi:hypothetical protein
LPIKIGPAPGAILPRAARLGGQRAVDEQPCLVAVVGGGHVREPLRLHARGHADQLPAGQPHDESQPLIVDRQRERAGAVEALARDALRAVRLFGLIHAAMVSPDRRRSRLVGGVDDVVLARELDALDARARPTHATDTARNAGCEIGDVLPKSLSWVEQRVAVVQRPERQRLARAVAAEARRRRIPGGGACGPAMPQTSPSPISASHAVWGSAGRSSPQPIAPASAEHTNTEKKPSRRLEPHVPSLFWAHCTDRRPDCNRRLRKRKHIRRRAVTPRRRRGSAAAS